MFTIHRNEGSGGITVSNGDSATTESSSLATNFDATNSNFAAYVGKLRPSQYYAVLNIV